MDPFAQASIEDPPAPDEDLDHPSFEQSFSDISGLSVGEGDIVESAEIVEERYSAETPEAEPPGPFNDDSFEQEETEAGELPDRMKFRAIAQTLAIRQAADDAERDGGVSSRETPGQNGQAQGHEQGFEQPNGADEREGPDVFDQPDYEPPRDSSDLAASEEQRPGFGALPDALSTSRAYHTPSPIEPITAPVPAPLGFSAGMPAFPFPDDDLPEATASSVVSLDDIASQSTMPPRSRASQAISDDLRADVEALNNAKRTPLPATATPAPVEQSSVAEPDDDELDPQQIEDDLDEAEFLAQQGLMEEARETLASVLERVPEHPRALEIRAAFQAGDAARDEEGSSAPPVPARADSGNSARGVDRISDDDVMSAFENVADGSDDESPEDHYDQGIAYRELNRLDDAIAHFKVAMRSETRGVDSLEMLGHCYLAKQDFENAINYYWEALEKSDGSAATNLKYEIASVYEVAGDAQQAITWFRNCFADDPDHRDVRGRLEALGAAPEDDPDPPASGQSPSNGSYPPHETAPSSASGSPKKSKISYI
jgi:tetratricopeptide (TPR) repeat protein